MESKRSEHWNISSLLDLLIHRWYLVFAAFLAAAAVGLVISWIWPSPYRASKDIYVAFDPSTMINDHYVEDIAQRQFRNGDDYKNWQMSQLSGFALSDNVLSEVALQLMEIDDRWTDLEIGDLRDSMKVGFRNTGNWHLVVEHRDAEYVETVLPLWEAELVYQVNRAIDFGNQLRVLDDQLLLLIEEQAELVARERQLQSVNNDLNVIFALLDRMQADAAVSTLFQSQIDARVGLAASLELSWSSTLAEKPVPPATVEDELAWLEDVRDIIEYELKIIPEMIGSIDEDIDGLQAKYELLRPQSHGFAPTLTIESHRASETITAERGRNPGTAALVGGTIGLLVLLSFQLWRSSAT